MRLYAYSLFLKRENVEKVRTKVLKASIYAQYPPFDPDQVCTLGRRVSRILESVSLLIRSPVRRKRRSNPIYGWVCPPAATASPCLTRARMGTRLSSAPRRLPGRFTISVVPLSPATPRESHA